MVKSLQVSEVKRVVLSRKKNGRMCICVSVCYCVQGCVCSLMWINWSRMVRQCSELQLRYRESSTATCKQTHPHTHRYEAFKRM
jgi:hypothetical protein